MKTNNLAVRPLISAREAEKMIWTFIYRGDHSHHDAMKGAPKHSIEEWFAKNGRPLHKVIPKCRSYFGANSGVPFVENYIGSTWHVSSDGADVKAALNKGGQREPTLEINGEGTIAVDYQSKFESACRARDRAVEGASIEELHTAIIKGIASIESYVTHRADTWNHSFAAHMQLTDQKNAKVSFEEKIKVWIPIMTQGKRLNLGGAMWADICLLQAIRDNDAIHAKKFGIGASYSDIAGALNKFKTGIADFLLQLHTLFEEPIPRAIIRARFFPEIYVQSVQK